MKTNRISLLLMFLGVFALSCHKDDTPQMSPAQAKSTFMNTNQDLSTEVSSLAKTSGYTGLKSFSSLTSERSPFGRIKSLRWLGVRKELSAAVASIRRMLFKASASERVQGDTPFDYAGKKGVYTWDPVKRSWSKTASSDIIKIDYPTEGSTTNNAEFQLTSYAEKSTPNGSELYSPTDIQASIYINGVKQTDLKLSMGYGDDDQPNMVQIGLYVNPYTITIGFDDSKSGSTTESFSFSKSDKTLISSNVTASYSSSTSKANGDPPSSVTGFIQLSTIRFDATIDGSKAASSSDPNTFIHISITINGANAGNVVFVTDSQTGEDKPYIQYNDKTQQSLDTLFTDLSTQISAIVF